jgi:AcrR family transcriptional regulator
MDQEIVAAAIAEAGESGKPIAEVSLDRIARRTGISRSTMFRRIRSRRALDDAVRAAGVDPGRRPGVRDRAVTAAAELIVAEGVGALTVEQVARRVGCAVTSVHTQCGGREGLLAAVFERAAPLPAVEDMMSAHPDRFAEFTDGVRAIYTVVFDAVAADVGVMEALIAEALAKPNGAVMGLVRERILPRINTTIGGWLHTQIQAGRCADLPSSVLLPMLIAPISVHLIARKRLIAAGKPVPDRRTVIETMTGAFCAAAGTPSAG